jgi:hypothetical protein
MREALVFAVYIAIVWLVARYTGWERTNAD